MKKMMLIGNSPIFVVYLFADKEHRASVSPPDLSADAPILNVFEPTVPILDEHFRLDHQLAVLYDFDEILGHILAVDVPLRLEHWLNNVLGPECLIRFSYVNG